MKYQKLFPCHCHELFLLKSRSISVRSICIASMLATLTLTACVGSSVATPTLEALVVEGVASPDGNGSLGSSTPGLSFARSFINDSGQVSFLANLTGTSAGNGDNLGLFLTNGTDLELVARKGQLAPDGNGRYESFGLDPFFLPSEANNFAVNENGGIAFAAELSGTTNGNSDSKGIFQRNGSTVSQVVRTGQTAPDGNGIFSDFEYIELNDAGQTALQVEIANSSSPSADGTAIYRADSGVLTHIARTGQLAPDGNGNFSFLSRPRLENSGNVAFAARHINTLAGTTDQFAIYRGNESALTTVVRGGEPAPNGPEDFATVSFPVVNDSGKTVFNAAFPSNFIGLYPDNRLILNDGISNYEVARTGQRTPDGVGDFSGFFGPILNNAGEVSFQADIDSTTSVQGIFKGDESGLITIVNGNQGVPEGNGAFWIFGGYDFNDMGQAVFQATLQETLPSNVNDEGIYFYDDELGLLKIAREGDSFLGSTLLINSNTRMSLNNQGQVVFPYVLADGRQGIALWSLNAEVVPEPNSAILLVTALAMMPKRRRTHLKAPKAAACSRN